MNKLTRKVVAGAAVLALVLGAAGVAGADTTIHTADVAVIGAASASPASLVRGATSPFSLSITANDGNIPDSTQNCDGVKNAATTQKVHTVSSTGITLSGTTETITFPCGNFSGRHGTPSTQTFNLDIGAASTAPLGAGNHAITVGASGTNVVLGDQLKLDANFVNPRVYVVVNPRPASDFSAIAGVQKVDLGWSASPDSADITDYEIAWSTGTSGGVLTAAKSATSLAHTGLTAGTQHCYTIRARYVDNGIDRFSAASLEECATPTAAAQTTTYTGAFQQPLDGDGVLNKAKFGRVVPVKTQITASDGSAVTGPVYFGARKVACDTGAPTDVVESYSAGSSNTGNTFRLDDGVWIYNLDTSKLPNATVGSCYQLDIFVGGTVDNNGIASGGAPVSNGTVKIQLTK